jgi:1-phosphofructokinase
MILTVTLNPAVDQTLWVERLAPGAINRPVDAQLDPAGKGVNASRMAHRLGWPTMAFGLAGGEVGAIVERTLGEERVPHHFVRVDGQTRINVTIVDKASGASTSLFAPGPPAPRAAIAELEQLIACWLQAGRVLVLGGSLPPGAPHDLYARWVRLAHARDVRTIVDADGDVLAQALPARPYLIKPNLAEAEQLLGRRLPDLASAVAAARELSERADVVVLSMGELGAVCVEGERAWRVTPPRIERLSTVGSGDSLVAGVAVALARGDGLLAGLRLGTAAGAATAMSPGTALGVLDEVLRLAPRVEIAELPRAIRS